MKKKTSKAVSLGKKRQSENESIWSLGEIFSFPCSSTCPVLFLSHSFLLKSVWWHRNSSSTRCGGKVFFCTRCKPQNRRKERKAREANGAHKAKQRAAGQGPSASALITFLSAPYRLLVSLHWNSENSLRNTSEDTIRHTLLEESRRNFLD